MVETPPNLPANEARAQLKREIIECIKKSISDLYEKHPDWFNDDRSLVNIASRYNAAHRIMNIIDNYEIGFRIPSQE